MELRNNFGKFLTRKRGAVRITRMTAYHRLLDEYIGSRSVLEVAREWRVPQWVLYDGLREQAKTPSITYLPRVALGMKMTADELLRKIAPQEVAP